MLFVVEVDVYCDRESVGESYWEWEGYVEGMGENAMGMVGDGYVECYGVGYVGGLGVGDWEWDGDGYVEWLTIVYLDWNLR